jgi:uncharacterized protein (DUF2344 family)
MNIVETNIIDINIENIDMAKVELANNIIKNVSPLLDEVHINNLDIINSLTKELQEKKQKVLKNKDELELLLNTFKRKQKVRKLLERIEKLVESGLVNEGHSKNETVVLLKMIDKLPDDKVEYHLKNTLNILTKRFS